MPLSHELFREVLASDAQTDFVAFESLWNVLVRASLSKRNGNEFQRLQLLVGELNPSQVFAFVHDESVDALLELDPPLETILSDGHERLYPEDAAREVSMIKTARKSKPNEAALALLSLLRRVRNKRIHGFKTPDGPRDVEILHAARNILGHLCNCLAPAKGV